MHKKENGKYATTFEMPEQLGEDLQEEAEEHPEDNQATIIRQGLRRELQRRKQE